jgi:hypothetical protein
MFKILFLFLICISSNSYSLEIDEKLTLRIVKVSESRKTMLINRGVEDGIVKGDHAKFFLTVGVVARAVAVKVSPTRSVWSVYRLVNADYIKNDQVMKLKITTAVKITKDNSKMLVSDDTVSSIDDPRNLGIPLAEGADDIGNLDLNGIKTTPMQSNGGFQIVETLENKNKELSLSFHYSGQTAKTSNSDSDVEYKATETNMVLTAGLEIFMKNQKTWYSRFSFLGVFSMSRFSALAHSGDSVQENTTEFGGGINWYPLTRPSKVYRIIPYGSFTFLMGSSETTLSPGSKTTGLTEPETLNAGTVGYIIGGGLRYYTPKGFGIKFNIEYYTRGDAFAADDAQTKWVKTKSGPRMNLGFLVRF